MILMDNQLSTKKQAEIEQLPFLTTKNSRIKNLTGKQFGRLTVLGLAPKPNNAETRAYWWCICSCP